MNREPTFTESQIRSEMYERGYDVSLVDNFLNAMRPKPEKSFAEAWIEARLNPSNPLKRASYGAEAALIDAQITRRIEAARVKEVENYEDLPIELARQAKTLSHDIFMDDEREIEIELRNFALAIINHIARGR